MKRCPSTRIIDAELFSDSELNGEEAVEAGTSTRPKDSELPPKNRPQEYVMSIFE